MSDQPENFIIELTMNLGSYIAEQITCGFHIIGQNRWYPTSYENSSQNGGDLTLECKSNHLTLFAMIETNLASTSDSGGLMIMVGLIIGIVVVIVFLFVFLKPK